MLLRQIGGPEFFAGSYRRYSGDLVSLGKGEIVYWQPDEGHSSRIGERS